MALIIPPNSSSTSVAELGLNRTDKAAGKTVSPVKNEPAAAPRATDGGLTISDAARLQLRSLASAERNANEVISMAQTADGALGRLGGLLEKMRDLATKNGDAPGEDTKVEFSRLQSEFAGIQKGAIYDGRSLLAEEAVEVGFDIVLEGGQSDRVALTLGGFGPLTVLAGSAESGGNSGRASSVLGRIDEALTAIADKRARFGAAVNRFADTAAAVQAARASRTAGGAPLESANAAEELANLVKGQVFGQPQGTLLVQANQLPAHAMSLLHD
jgi:flagellin